MRRGAAAPGREAEEAAVDGEALREPDDDRNLTPSEEGGRPADRPEVDGGRPADRPEVQGAAEVTADLDALTEAEQQRDEYLELAKRAQADFENYRKRMSAEVLAANGRGKGEVLRAVVPVLDDLERAIQAAGLDPEGDSEDGLAHGVLLVFRGLRETLVSNGIEPLDPAGEKFDPQLHEALSALPAEGVESGTVIEVMQKGYRLGDQLVRPARVVVAE
jgi:molecular chaperone GrpE